MVIVKCSGCLKIGNDLIGIKCSLLNCDKLYCSQCINITGITSERKKSWKCPDCSAANKKGGDNSLTPARSSNESQNVTSRKIPESSLVASENVTVRKKPESSLVTEVSEVKELTSELRQLTQEISSLKHRLEEATESLIRCHSRLDELGAAVAANESRINKIEDREKEVLSLKTEVTLLQRDLNSQAQAHLRNELEISGIPESPSENLQHTVLVIAKKFGVELVEGEIDWVTRVGARQLVSSLPENRKGVPRPVVVRLLRRSKRDILVKASKSRKNITSEDLGIQGPALKVYFNERLTKENRILFREARIRAKSHGYAFCWCNQGSIYIRQREGKAAMHVSSRENLDNMLSPCIGI